MVSNPLYCDAHFMSEAMWHAKMCLSVLQSSTPHELTAAADTHTEHNQCHMYLSKIVRADAQCYVTQFHIYTPECLSWKEGLYYFCILLKLSFISGRMIKNCFITQDYEAADLCITRNISRTAAAGTINITIMATTTTTMTTTTNATKPHLLLLLLLVLPPPLSLMLLFSKPLLILILNHWRRLLLLVSYNNELNLCNQYE